MQPAVMMGITTTIITNKFDSGHFAMKKYIFISPRPGSGVNTVAVNLAVGLTRMKFSVCLVSSNEKLSEWLTGPEGSQRTLLARNPDLTWVYQTHANIDCPADYLFYIPATPEEVAKALKNRRDALIFCIMDLGDDLLSINNINQYVANMDEISRGIDLFIPNKVKPGEWEKSSAFLMELASQFGYERIADTLPYCEAIHDLAKERQSVWDLPDNYSNRKAAFQRLAENVLELDNRS